MSALIFDPKDRDRVLAKIYKRAKKDASGCWLLGGSRAHRKGYGRARYKKKEYAAHRLVYLALNGSFDASLSVCHSCDVRNCVNPDHLFLGTHWDNMSDMLRKSRAAWQKPVKDDELILGSKLTPETHEFAFWLRYEVGLTNRQIAKIFDYRIKTMAAILGGRALKTQYTQLKIEK